MFDLKELLRWLSEDLDILVCILLSPAFLNKKFLLPLLVELKTTSEVEDFETLLSFILVEHCLVLLFDQVTLELAPVGLEAILGRLEKELTFLVDALFKALKCSVFLKICGFQTTSSGLDGIVSDSLNTVVFDFLLIIGRFLTSVGIKSFYKKSS